jgi:sugar phosphate permease
MPTETLELMSPPDVYKQMFICLAVVLYRNTTDLQANIRVVIVFHIGDAIIYPEMLDYMAFINK